MRSTGDPLRDGPGPYSRPPDDLLERVVLIHRRSRTSDDGWRHRTLADARGDEHHALEQIVRRLRNDGAGPVP